MSPRALLLAVGLAGAAAATVGLLAGGCADPIHDRAVDALGEEAEKPGEGEFHRAGEPCGTCHQASGPAEKVFSVAGTIFASPDSQVGVYNAEVQLTDSVGTQFIATTNCVGNFFVTPDQWTPKFPILVRVKKGPTARAMKSPIGREASCAACHKLTLNDNERHRYKPHIALFGEEEPAGGGPDAGCPADPVKKAGPNTTPGGTGTVGASTTGGTTAGAEGGTL